jgi:decaprenylphospho-beta-D-ribofuranose 2-oxidase
VFRPRSAEEVAETLCSNAWSGVIARGAGRSYGDAAQNGGGAVLDMTGLDRVLSIDPERGLITAEAGATVAEMMARLAAHGLTLPVVPGTRHVTLAGAIASDIHGKNHHRDGALSRHVQCISLCTPAGEVVELTAESDRDLFFATIGGMGLTGVILSATVRAQTLGQPWVAEDVDRTNGLEHTLELMSGAEPRRYSVAWLDMLARGSKMGRAVVSRADQLPADTPPPAPRGRRAAAYPGVLSRAPVLEIPRAVRRGMLTAATVRAFNAARWQATRRIERARPMALAPYFFPLDGVGGWNRLYGRDGFIQHQFVIPSGREEELRQCFEVLRGLPVYLAVFKRFGDAFGGPLSFPLRGWTLAVDLPASVPEVRARLDRVDEIVAGCGGRVYLTKDIRLRREHLKTMYPELDRFHQQRASVDPGAVMRSDLGARLGLCEAGH